MEVQQAAAQFNNRGFVYKCLDKMLQDPFPAEQVSPSFSSVSDLSLGQIEMTQGQPIEEEAPFELNNPSAFHFNQQQLSPIMRP